MLQAMRDKMTGWLAYAIIALISIPFALWGLHEYVSGGSGLPVATVNGDDIPVHVFDNEYRATRERLAAQLNGVLPEAIQQEAKQQTLDNLINQRLVESFANQSDLHISNDSVLENIREIELFQVDGQFDKTKYNEVLALRELSHEQLKRNLSRSMRVNQVRSMLSDSVFQTSAQIEALFLRQEQTRDVSYRVIKVDDFSDKVSIDEAAIKAYYDEHKAEHYSTKERAKVSYVDLSVEALSENITPTEEQIQAAYDAYLADNEGQDIRTAAHILVRAKADDEAEEKAALEKITAIKARIDGGEDFAAVATETSEDLGSARNGGSLGDVRKGQMVAPFEEALFAMEAGTVSEPVKTRFGYHIIQLSKIASAAKPFDEIKNQLTKDAKLIEAKAEFEELVEAVTNAAYENEGSLDLAAAAFGGEVLESDWITRREAQGVLNHPQILSAAFSDGVINEGINSKPVRLGEGRLVVLRALAHEPAAPKALDEVKEKVTADLTLSRQKQAVESSAKAIVEAAQTSGDAAAALNAEGEVKTSAKLARDAQIESLPLTVTNKAFATPLDQAAYQIVGNGDAVVLVVEQVNLPEVASMTEEQKTAIKVRLAQTQTQQSFERLMKYLNETGDIVRYELP